MRRWRMVVVLVVVAAVDGVGERMQRGARRGQPGRHEIGSTHVEGHSLGGQTAGLFLHVHVLLLLVVVVLLLAVGGGGCFDVGQTEIEGTVLVVGILAP